VIRAARAELAAGVTLLIVYVATLAPGVTLWDSGEFLAAIHSLGIPHPPGTPLYVLIANVWAKIWSPFVGFAYSVNLLSAVCTALGCALLANLFVRWTGDRLAAFAAAVCAGAMSSVWLSANETEVYSAALLGACLLLWLGNIAGETGQRRWLLLGAYVAGLGVALHLAALLALPAALYLAMRGRRPRHLRREAPALLLMFALGASATLFLIVRAQHDPMVNQGNPSSWPALMDVVRRRQYAPAPLWPRQAPWFIQIGNLFEYADWQVALGVSPDAPPSWLRTPITMLYGALGVVGFSRHHAADRRSWRAMVILFVTATLGVIVYLNLKAGPSYGSGFLPANAPHEARERDYFFALAFVCWGLWVGFGSVRAMRAVARRFTTSPSSTQAPIDAPRDLGWLRFAGAAVAIFPIALNWGGVSRRFEPAASEARRDAIRILETAPPKGIVLARGDNEAYPVWYMQEVEGLRRDVTVVVVPLLPARWYRAELARREKLLTPDFVKKWNGEAKVVAAICRAAVDQQRPVRMANWSFSTGTSPTCTAPPLGRPGNRLAPASAR
jgi:4-amino-4-deoxy-L-arabinose transferase-like glycosyltransferase